MEKWTLEQIRGQAAATRENMRFAADCMSRAITKFQEIVPLIIEINEECNRALYKD